MHTKKLLYSALALFLLVLNSCKKQEFTTPALAEFVSTQTSNKGAYFVADDPNSTFKVPIGITTPSNKDRAIQFSVTSPTGAVDGTQFTIGTNTITIPAGKTVDSIAVKGHFAAYNGGRKDTLIFKITGGDVDAFTAQNSYTLIVRQFCPVVSLTEFEGDYDNTNDDGGPAAGGYGPYSTTITAGTITGTTGTITVSNFYDVGGSDLTFTLDFTDPSNYKTTFVAQDMGVDASILGASYHGPLWIYPVGTGTFSSCDQTFRISYHVGVPNGVQFGTEYTILAR